MTRITLFSRTLNYSSKYFYSIARNIKATSQEKAPKLHLNVGTIGHVDHGKTTLSSAITKYLSKNKMAKFISYDDIDRAPQERARGITINIANLEYETKERHYAHIDCPGHSDYIKNMITGTSQMDAAILVIAATDGVMPQTKEHLMLAKQIGLEEVIVFINKADLVDKDDLELVEMEARELLNDYSFNGETTKVINGSALQALQGEDHNCIDELLKALDSLKVPNRAEEGSFLMPIANKIKIPNSKDSVLIGTVERGQLKKGEQLEIRGFEHFQKVTAGEIQVFKKTVNQVRAGEQCGILCRNLIFDGVHKGMWLGAPGTVQTTNIVKIKLYMLNENENGRKQGIRSGHTVLTFCTTWDKGCRIFFDNELLMPGEVTNGYLVFLREVPIRKGCKITLRESRRRVLGHGVVVELYEQQFLDTWNRFDAEGFLKDLKPLDENKKRK
uniref:protein-synthesizing GTPase n=1 Tax=Meloidogyne incognita TaxID=6306 RepID=A0A914KRV7_MELIC